MSWRLPSLGILLLASLTGYSADPVNVVREPGVKLTADCHYAKFTPDKAGDGDDSAKESRWVSSGEHSEHWLAADFGTVREVNQIGLKFWNDGCISADFDIQVKDGDAWKTVREVRGNALSDCRFAFPTAKTAGVRIVFKKQFPDKMVRLYEFAVFRLEHPVEIAFSDGFRNGMLIAAQKPALELRNFAPRTPAELTVGIELLDENGKVLKTFREKRKFQDADSVPLPLPDQFGRYSYRVNLLPTQQAAFFFPSAAAKYKSSSPFGSHYHSSSDLYVNHAGIYWWRNHDVYGRWSGISDEKGKIDWSGFDDRMAFVRANGIRECPVYLGAPRNYSTVLSGEPVSGPHDSIYSYYPPADLDAWVSDYLLPMAERVKQASPHHVHEIWNEAWSYYRLRGLHGTAGEAAQLFRVSYEALKKADPDAPVYATDVKPEMIENRYAFKNFGRDLFELGFLRYNDLLSYHSYGIMTYPRLEKMRRNLWDFGRDFELWSTETAVEGKPAYMLMESLAAHRGFGNGKTFIYSGSRWAPLSLDGQPTLYLVAQAALCRALGDALPLGSFEADGIRCFVFANGPEAVAVLFTDSEQPVTPKFAAGELEDMFGRKVTTVSKEEPAIARKAPLALVRKALAERIAFHATEAGGEGCQPLSARIAAAPDAGFAKLLDREIAELRKQRRTLSDDRLYTSGKILDLLSNARIMLARRDGAKFDAPTLAAVRKAVAGEWRAATGKTGNNGVLLNTERLISRAQKEMQYAAEYDSDGDATARDFWLQSAADNLANAKARLGGEGIAKLYRTKSYFRSHKRLIRSERYCFPGGRAQEAVITLANPFGHELKGTLEVTPPPGWTSDRMEIPYQVPPMSRQLLDLKLTAPKEFKPGETVLFKATDRDGNFPEITAELEVLKKIPPYPVLDGPLSGGELTGN